MVDMTLASMLDAARGTREACRKYEAPHLETRDKVSLVVEVGLADKDFFASHNHDLSLR